MADYYYLNLNALIRNAVFKDDKRAQAKLYNLMSTVLDSRTGKLWEDKFDSDQIEDIKAVTIARFFHKIKKKGEPFPNDVYDFPDIDALGKCVNTFFKYVRLEFIREREINKDTGDLEDIIIRSISSDDTDRFTEEEKMYLILEQCMEKLGEPCRSLIIDRKYKEIKITNDFLKKHGFEENKKGYSQCTSRLNRCLGKLKKCATAN